MDEPTAALAVKEVGKVLDLIKGLKDHGVGIILISHRMDDVFYVCDRVMALFHGRNFAEAPLKATNRNEVIGWIMGTKGHTDGARPRQGALRWRIPRRTRDRRRRRRCTAICARGCSATTASCSSSS